MSTTSEVLNAAMNLNLEQRCEVAHQLLLSLEPETSDDAIDQAWAYEVRRRRQAIREGRSTIREGRSTIREWDDEE